MNCPYCNEEMELGSIESLDTLRWTPEGESRPRTTRWTTNKNGVVLDNCGLVKRAKVKAYYCRQCRAIIIKL